MEGKRVQVGVNREGQAMSKDGYPDKLPLWLMLLVQDNAIILSYLS